MLPSAIPKVSAAGHRAADADDSVVGDLRPVVESDKDSGSTEREGAGAAERVAGDDRADVLDGAAGALRDDAELRRRDEVVLDPVVVVAAADASRR